MFAKAVCPVCKEEIICDIEISAFEHRPFSSVERALQYTIDNVEVAQTLTEDELMKDILTSLRKKISDGIEIDVLEDILKEKYGIVGACCKGMVDKIKIELGMYSPDRVKLYYV
jgi:hypothetical protein